MVTAATDIQFLKGVGEKRAILLKNKGIDTVGALLRFYPRAYLDWTSISKISECPFDQNVCVKAKIITEVKSAFIRPGMTVYKFIAEDVTAQISVTLFNQKFLADKLNCGSEYLFYGKVNGDFVMRQMSSPVIMETGYNGIEPIYPAIGKLSSKVIEKLVRTAVENVSISETLPAIIIERNNLCNLDFAIRNIHFPRTTESFERAKKRLVFEELFILQTSLSFLKKRSRGMTGCVLNSTDISEFEKAISFDLTGSQKRVINECLTDMTTGRPMNRLVQGDVGSGKTAVAAALCYISARNGFQCALMAPTEILAEQHYKTMCVITVNTGIKCGLLIGSMTKKQKNIVKEELKQGEIDVIVGTHALLSDNVEFDNLGLVITDEQHRFGVAQRGKLSAKGDNPNTLVMSATPIPRTLGLIIYGDLDISIINEYPKGRQIIDTYCVTSDYHQRIYNYIKKYLDVGRQAYIVCPLVDENEESDITSAVEYYEELKGGEFSGYNLGLLHGKMPAKDKERIMSEFAKGNIDLLVATTVIEVGIDVPNAVVMVIENAERFGLSQLHQLRGRIGRGVHKSSCILISDVKFGNTKKRLDVIKNCHDGFKIADEDLALRGPGDFLGNRQHGLPDMKIADIFADGEVLKLAGRESQFIINCDPNLSAPENAGLRKEIQKIYNKLNKN